MKKIETLVKSGKFVLHVISYRPLTRQEVLLAVAEYQRACGLKFLPKTGSGTVVTSFGAV
ncbi:MAG: hypothetical protein MJZ26_14850 [Fibrobacter sp.]|nr:hypothetical protein [Fibrobacter sp.]